MRLKFLRLAGLLVLISSLSSCAPPGVPCGWQPPCIPNYQPKPAVFSAPPQCSAPQSFLFSFQPVSIPQSQPPPQQLQFSIQPIQPAPPVQQLQYISPPTPQIQYFQSPPPPVQYQSAMPSQNFCACPPQQSSGIKFKILGYGNGANSQQQYIYVQPETATGTFELQTVNPNSTND